MVKISINGNSHEVPQGITIIQACEIAGIEIPRFCYHERLAIAGNCRMCLVEVAGGPPKPVASCAMPVNENMQIFTDTPMVKKAREGVMEFLLANHPLDCPICDQAGECDLQDQAYQYGKGESDYHEHKRAVSDKNMGPLIKTQMTRCIHCTRCVRFVEDVAGTYELGAINRGEGVEITTYLERNMSSELSGNVIDLCPVGALTSKPYAFKARSWELKKTETIDIMDAVGSNIRIDSRGLEVMRILPRLNEEINEEWISDKARFCYDGFKYQRLDKPYLKIDGKFLHTSFEDCYEEIKNQIAKIEPNQIGALTGNLSSLEDIFALKKLMQALGVENIDCRLSSQKLNSAIKNEFLFNTSIAGIEEADACLLIGVNPRRDAPILNARLRKRFLSKKIKIALVGNDIDLTYDHQVLGGEIKILQSILAGENPFCETLQKAKNNMLIIGEDTVSRKDGAEIIQLCKAIATKYNMLRDDWNGFNFLAKSTGLINGLELDFVNKKTTREIVDQAQNGEIKLLFLQNVDDEIDFSKLQNCFVIYLGSNGDRGAKIANIILPTCNYIEKDALYMNLEGRIQKSRKAVFGVGEAKIDFEIICQIAQKLNLDLGFKNYNELLSKLDEEHNILSRIDKINNNYAKSLEVFDNNSQLNFVEEDKLLAMNYDYYLTNAITRASKILHKVSAENNKIFNF
jgi:NADH-quinone oxidoreductase subunit G